MYNNIKICQHLIKRMLCLFKKKMKIEFQKFILMTYDMNMTTTWNCFWLMWRRVQALCFCCIPLFWFYLLSWFFRECYFLVFFLLLVNSQQFLLFFFSSSSLSWKQIKKKKQKKKNKLITIDFSWTLLLLLLLF